MTRLRYSLALLTTAAVLTIAMVAAAPRDNHRATVEPTSIGGIRTLVASPVGEPSGAEPSTAAVEREWSAAAPLDVPLVAGDTTGPPITVHVRAVYSPSSIYLWLQWADDLSGTASFEARQQRATLTWKQTAPIGGCAVSCHTSFSLGKRIDSMQVVAPDVGDDLPHLLVGDWRDGEWTLGYERPLITGDPIDVQFADLRQTYAFGLDVSTGRMSSHTHGEDLTLRFQAR